MERSLSKLVEKEFDLVIVGGGIHGACTAWEAASRGLSTALLEKKDFAWATSANSLKIIHGGFRYLQHADIKRMRESSLERKALMQIAPHLVHPLPVLLPTYGHGMKGREILGLGLAVNHFITWDRNRSIDPNKRIPAGKVLSKSEVLAHLPGLEPKGLTGGVVFYDAQVYNSERLVLAFLHSAWKAGANLANYVEVTGLLHENGEVKGVQVKDGSGGGTFEVRSRLVINTTGPWVEQFRRSGSRTKVQAGLAKAVNLVTRSIFNGHAVGLMGQNNLRDRDALVDKGSSFLFVAPWRGKSILGTNYSPYNGDPETLHPTRQDVLKLLAEFNRAYPAAQLTEGEVTFVHTGLLPASSLDNESEVVDLQKHHRLIEHDQEGLHGMISVVGVKYTTARQVAKEVIELAARKLGGERKGDGSGSTGLHGGGIENFQAFLTSLIGQRPCRLGEKSIRNLVYNYGSGYSAVLDELDPAWQSRGLPEEQALLEAQVRHAIKNELALKLTDVVLRRTELGTAERPQMNLLRAASRVMAASLGWDQEREQRELEEVNEIYNFTRQ